MSFIQFDDPFTGFGGSNDDKSDESEPAEIEVKEQSARPTDSVTFKIYALKKSVIDQVKQKINTCLEGETMTKTFDDGVIALLDDNQVLGLFTARCFNFR